MPLAPDDSKVTVPLLKLKSTFLFVGEPYLKVRVLEVLALTKADAVTVPIVTLVALLKIPKEDELDSVSVQIVLPKAVLDVSDIESPLRRPIT